MQDLHLVVCVKANETAKRSLGFGDLEEVKNDRNKIHGPRDSVLRSVF